MQTSGTRMVQGLIGKIIIDPSSELDKVALVVHGELGEFDSYYFLLSSGAVWRIMAGLQCLQDGEVYSASKHNSSLIVYVAEAVYCFCLFDQDSLHEAVHACFNKTQVNAILCALRSAVVQESVQ